MLTKFLIYFVKVVFFFKMIFSFLEEGRLLQVTAGVKVGSSRKSADGTENDLDTIMTPL